MSLRKRPYGDWKDAWEWVEIYRQTKRLKIVGYWRRWRGGWLGKTAEGVRLYKASKTSHPIALKKKRRREGSRTASIKAQPLVGVEYMRADPCAYCGGVATQWEHVDPVF